MARLIVKSPYIKCGVGHSAGGYMRYIATRERVELIQDNRPPTRKQEQLIAKLVKDFPDAKEMGEYGDYQERPTKANASAFISQALEENWSDVQKSDGYMKYIATRPRAERLGSHGLFSDKDGVELDKAMAELEDYTGNVWTHIISLKREDAERLGYDNARAWRNLLRAHRNDIAAAMNIPPQDFRWYAAFHDEGDHPHVHMMAWSVKPGQAYLSQDGIRQIKSKLTNDIFQQEMLHLYEQKTVSRDQLVREARQAMRELVQQMRTRICDHPEAERLMQELTLQLERVKGKKSYGYLPKKQKALVDEIVDQMEQLPTVAECYEQWWQLQGQVEDFYSEKERHRPPLSRQKEFRQIKNAVIQEAETIRLGKITFEDDTLDQSDEAEKDENVSWDFRTLRIDVQDEYSSLAERDDAVESMRELAENGDIHAQYFMGELYRDGPLLPPDWVMARYWFDKAAKQGYVAAQYALGKLYLSDDASVHDPELGIQWLEYAAYNGNHDASYRLGKGYLKGESVRRDTRKAIDHIYTSAQAGNLHAQYLLGKLCLGGDGVPQDKDAAYDWFQKAQAQGHDYAGFFMDRIERPEPPNVLLSATRLLYHMGKIFQSSVPAPQSCGVQIDRKRLAKLRRMRIAAGHKADDHEQEQTSSTMSMGW